MGRPKGAKNKAKQSPNNNENHFLSFTLENDDNFSQYTDGNETNSDNENDTTQQSDYGTLDSRNVSGNSQTLSLSSINQVSSPLSNNICNGQLLLSPPSNFSILPQHISNNNNSLLSPTTNFDNNNIDNNNELMNENNHEENYNINKLLIDIDCVDFGILTSCKSSLTFIPENLVSKFRLVCNKYMQNIINDSTNILHWKKWILLPLIVTSSVDKRHRKDVIRKKLDLLLNDIWDFTICDFLNINIITPTNINTESSIEKRAIMFANKGEIGKCLNILNRSNRVIRADEMTYRALQAKHPAPGESLLSEDDILKISNFHLPDDSVDKIRIDESTLIKFIKKTKYLVRHGIDKLRYEHIRQLVGYQNPNNPRQDEQIFIKSYINILELMIHGKVPSEALPLFRDNEELALPKGENDIRPIGMGNTHRKIAAAMALQSTYIFNKEYFKDIQFGLDKFGTEKIIHTFRHAYESNNHNKDMFALDGDNAFNNMNRKRALFEVMDKYPSLFSFLRDMYGTNSNCWFKNENNEVLPILSSEGVTQGDTFGSWVYSIATLPLAKSIKNIIGDNNIIKLFIDDTNIVADFDNMIKAIDHIDNEGGAFGYYIKRSKGSYLIGKCESNEEAIEKKNALILKGFDASIIHIHPENGGNTGEYGMKVVGSYIGHNDYIRNQLDLKLQELSLIKDSIINFNNLQVKNLMFTFCFNQKINFLQRTTPPSIISDFVDKFDTYKKEIFCSLLSNRYTPSTIPDLKWEQSCMPISDGGLGYQNVKCITYVAYISSIYDCIDAVKSSFPDYEISLDNNNNIIESFRKLSIYCDRDINFKELDLIQLSNKNPIQHNLSTICSTKSVEFFKTDISNSSSSSAWCADDVAWLISLCNSNSGKWLQAASKADNVRMTNNEFSSSIFYRMKLPNPNIICGTKCNCKSAPLLDTHGTHITTACGKGGFRQVTHNNMCYEIMSCCKSVGLLCKSEEYNLFYDNKKRTDITIHNAPGYLRKVILDLTITCPFPTGRDSSDKLDIKNALIPFRAAKLAAIRKRTKYNILAEANNLAFFPIVVESTGAFLPESEKLIDSFLKHYTDGDEKYYANLKNYWYTCFSVKLQKYLAQSLITRASTINGKQTGIAYTFCNSRSFIDTFDCIN